VAPILGRIVIMRQEGAGKAASWIPVVLVCFGWSSLIALLTAMLGGPHWDLVDYISYYGYFWALIGIPTLIGGYVSRLFLPRENSA